MDVQAEDVLVTVRGDGGRVDRPICASVCPAGFYQLMRGVVLGVHAEGVDVLLSVYAEGCPGGCSISS